LSSRTGHRWQYGICALQAGYLRQQTQVHNMYYLLLFHYNKGCANACRCYLLHTTPDSFYFLFFTNMYQILWQEKTCIALFIFSKLSYVYLMRWILSFNLFCFSRRIFRFFQVLNGFSRLKPLNMFLKP
jgi:hypothetical protein